MAQDTVGREMWFSQVLQIVVKADDSLEAM